jgi:hypothetical protein
MSTNTANAEKRTDSTVRQPHVVMGIDATGAVHHLFTPSQTVYVAHPDEGLQHAEDISAPRDDTRWVAYVGQERGWDMCWYFTSATGGWF